MHIFTRHEYAATPERVSQLMRSQEYLSALAKRVKAENDEVSFDGDKTSLRATIDAPSEVQKILGEQLTFIMTVDWGKLENNRSVAELSLEILKLPANLQGTATLQGTDSGSAIDYETEFSVTVPLMGKRLEEHAAPYIKQMLDIQQEVGNELLASQNDQLQN